MFSFTNTSAASAARFTAASICGFSSESKRPSTWLFSSPSCLPTPTRNLGISLVAELLDDRLQPVVTARRAARPQAQSPKRQVRIVVNDEQIVWCELVKRRKLADRPSAQVHEGRRLGQQHAVAEVGNLRRLCFPLRVILQCHTIAARKLFGNLKPDVMPRVLVIAAGIAKTNNQLQGV